MRKILFTLLVFVSANFIANAQTSTDIENVADAQMITLVHAMKPNYVPGMKLPDWIKTTGPYAPSPNDLLFLEKTFNYISLNTSDCDIAKADNSVVLNIVKSPISDSPLPNARKWSWTKFWEVVGTILSVVILHYAPSP